MSSFLGGFNFNRFGVCCFIVVWSLVSGTLVDGLVPGSTLLLSGTCWFWSSSLVFLLCTTVYI